MNIFQDESGCFGFARGSSKFFIIALFCPENSKLIGHIVRKFKGKLIRHGWPKTVEIKASHLHYAKYDSKIPSTYIYKNNPDQPIFDILGKLATQNIEVDAIIVKKAHINADLRTLPYGVLYNYYSKNVLIERIIKYDIANLYIDRTSKQTHKLRRFDDYIYTEAFIAKGCNFQFDIIHCDSNIVTGICAVDFISWALSRKYEQNDGRFFQIFRSKIKELKTYYF